MKTSTLAVSCLLVLPLVAQHAPIQVNLRKPISVTQQITEPPALKKSITIRLHGTNSNGAEIDFSLAGIGPKFLADQLINDETILQCDYVVSETETGYLVSYIIGSRITIRDGDNMNSARSSSRDTIRDTYIRGTVLCANKKTQVLVQNGSKSLKLTITEDEGQAAPSKGG